MADNPQSGSGAGGASGAPPPANSTGAGRGQPNGGKRSRLGIIIPLVLLLVLVGAAGAYWYLKIRGVISTDDAYVDGDRVAVSTKMLGRITRLGTDEGDTVQAQQLLVQLDDSDLRAQEAQREAALALAQENVALAEAREHQASDDLHRAEVQFRGHAITQEALDHARTALIVARTQHAIALAQVRTARADLNTVQTQIQDTRVVAPLDGVVAKRWVLPGDVVQPGQPIFTLYDLKNVWITANFEETKLAAIAVGAGVDIQVDAYPGRRFQGRVVRIGAAAASQFSLIPPNNASGNFTKVTQRVPVRIAVERAADGAGDAAPILLPGMSVEVTIEH